MAIRACVSGLCNKETLAKSGHFIKSLSYAISVNVLLLQNVDEQRTLEGYCLRSGIEVGFVF